MKPGPVAGLPDSLAAPPPLDCRPPPTFFPPQHSSTQRPTRQLLTKQSLIPSRTVLRKVILSLYLSRAGSVASLPVHHPPPDSLLQLYRLLLLLYSQLRLRP
ncbi:hypothetical protein BU16DRAFT_387148 [Lophium mytilinum]|uniref:Uncharacterized protein n=1 Tax=Lophium mytilinum TaxID=390894 RepID=A0A6A6QUD8_9PEZI|nr:hypothetical protein BU16DRAFT_387148 [Lophium mytilinum]